VRYVVFESRGQVSVVPESSSPDGRADLLRGLLEAEDDRSEPR
jgi:hypothetical protein